MQNLRPSGGDHDDDDDVTPKSLSANVKNIKIEHNKMMLITRIL